MIDVSKMDLHMHSTVSDGTDTPVELLAKVKSAGLEVFALTDHDAVKGCGMIRRCLRPGDPVLITGVEFSCRDGEGQYHILGYGYDPEDPRILRVVELGHNYRREKLRLRLEYLERVYHITFPENEVARLSALANPGKPHIANLMVEFGYAASRNEAIEQVLNKIRLPSQYVRPEEAIDGILGAGGVPVLAHPALGSGSQLITGPDMDRRLDRLIGMGLQGMEVFYSTFTPAQRDEMLAFARSRDLYVSAGSDYHGCNKPIVLGQTGLTPSTPVPGGLRRLLERLGAA